jgi:hypothetical protein
MDVVICTPFIVNNLTVRLWPPTVKELPHLRYRFTHCVRAAATSAVAPETWYRSLDERLLDLKQGRELDGYLWGVR